MSSGYSYGDEGSSPEEAWRGAMPEPRSASGADDAAPSALPDGSAADRYAPQFSASPAPAHQPLPAQNPSAPPPAAAGMPALPAPTSGFAIAGFVLGLLSMVTCSGITAPFGLVFSILGLQETRAGAAQRKSGSGLAIAGLILSVFMTLLVILMIVLMMTGVLFELIGSPRRY